MRENACVFIEGKDISFTKPYGYITRYVISRGNTKQSNDEHIEKEKGCLQIVKLS